MSRARLSAVVVTIVVLCAACDHQEKHSSDQPGAVGTSGSASVSVKDTLSGDAPTFVGRDAHATRIWKLTRQFYQNRDDAPATFHPTLLVYQDWYLTASVSWSVGR